MPPFVLNRGTIKALPTGEHNARPSDRYLLASVSTGFLSSRASGLRNSQSACAGRYERG